MSNYNPNNGNHNSQNNNSFKNLIDEVFDFDSLAPFKNCTDKICEYREENPEKFCCIVTSIIILIVIIIIIVSVAVGSNSKKNINDDSSSRYKYDNNYYLEDDDDDYYYYDGDYVNDNEPLNIPGDYYDKKGYKYNYKNDDNYNEYNNEYIYDYSYDYSNYKISLNKTEKNRLLKVYNSIGTISNSSLDIFCDYLQKICSNFTDEEKIYFIYYWITHNIKYDITNYFSMKKSDNIPRSLFINKTTDSSGYSKLFTHLLKCTNYNKDKIHNVVGYAKEYINIDNINTNNIIQTNHEWNIVEIGNKSCLIDTTWGAGFVTRNKKFIRKYDNYYLCSPPLLFIRDHLPQNNESDMQNIEPKITVSEFMNQAHILKYFYKLGFKSIKPDLNILNVCGAGKIILNYINDVRPILITKLIKNGSKIENSVINKKIKYGYNVSFYINEIGNYTLDIYSNKRSYGYLPLIGSFKINCQETPTDKKYFPYFSYKYETTEVQLISPLDRDLISGNKYNFKFQSSDKKIILSFNGLNKEMNKNENVFTLNDALIEGTPGDTISILNGDGVEYVKYKIK